MKSTLFMQNGQRIRIKAKKVGYMLWLHINGQTWAIDQKPKAKSKINQSQNPQFDGELNAPMPGKILRVNIKKGDQVVQNQILAVMEAMKMEYSLAAPCPGTIVELNCIESQQVELGQLLIKINPTK